MSAWHKNLFTMPGSVVQAHWLLLQSIIRQAPSASPWKNHKQPPPSMLWSLIEFFLVPRVKNWALAPSVLYMLSTVHICPYICSLKWLFLIQRESVLLNSAPASHLQAKRSTQIEATNHSPATHRQDAKQSLKLLFVVVVVFFWHAM